MQFPYHTIHPFRLCRSVIFSIFTRLCNCPPLSNSRTFSLPPKETQSPFFHAQLKPCLLPQVPWGASLLTLMAAPPQHLTSSRLPEERLSAACRAANHAALRLHLNIFVLTLQPCIFFSVNLQASFKTRGDI